MTPTTRMHVLRRCREIVSEILTEEEKKSYEILSLMDEVIAGIAKHLEQEAQRVDLASRAQASAINVFGRRTKLTAGGKSEQ